LNSGELYFGEVTVLHTLYAEVIEVPKMKGTLGNQPLNPCLLCPPHKRSTSNFLAQNSRCAYATDDLPRAIAAA